jgi:hypothetical protein
MLVFLGRHAFCIEAAPAGRPQWFRFTCPDDQAPGVILFPAHADLGRERPRCPSDSVRTEAIEYDI